MPPTDDASYQDWHALRNANDSWAALYPVALGPLQPEEVNDFVRHVSQDQSDVDVTGVLGSVYQAVRFAYELAEGHPGGMRLVLRAMSQQRQMSGAENVDVRGLFGWADPRHNNLSLADEALHLLIGEWSPRLRRTLIRSTAARNFGEAELAPALDGASAEIADMMADFRSLDLWVQHSPAENTAQAPTLHRFPQRAVMHLLTAPARQGDPTWDDVHRRMQTCAKERGDTISEMYHCLARGGITDVTEYLSELFVNEDTQTWYDTLRAITAAPLAHPSEGENSEEQWRKLVEEADKGFIVGAALVAALQIHTDPLGDPAHSLCMIIAQELEGLARHSRSGLLTLRDEGKIFRDCSSGSSTKKYSKNTSTGRRGV